jgi:hypothetical protein
MIQTQSQNEEIRQISIEGRDIRFWSEAWCGVNCEVRWKVGDEVLWKVKRKLFR